jgi:acyl-CoA synthetase (AMP-forming)/AMP-acid ligase II
MGEVMFRGNVVMKGYLKNKKATDEAFKGGWFHSGDLGVMHPDGYIQLKDRSKDIIISGGENISSIEVEDALYKHPAVQAAAVVAKAGRQMGRDALRLRRAEAGQEATKAETSSTGAGAPRGLQGAAARVFTNSRRPQHRQDPEVQAARPRSTRCTRRFSYFPKPVDRRDQWPRHRGRLRARLLRGLPRARERRGPHGRNRTSCRRAVSAVRLRGAARGDVADAFPEVHGKSGDTFDTEACNRRTALPTKP